jgi:hypothetical protein
LDLDEKKSSSNFSINLCFYAPSLRLENQYKSKGYIATHAKTKDDFYVINLHHIKDDFINWSNKKYRLNVAQNNYHKYTWQAMEYINENFPDAIGFMVLEKDNKFANGYKVLIKNINGI